jgi:glycerol-3-phosphate dehydrogenase (NAD(P)+)
VEIGRGRTLDEALAGKPTVAEGVATTKSAVALAARLDVEMPIVDTVNRVLFAGHSARRAIPELMQRGLRAEQDA